MNMKGGTLRRGPHGIALIIVVGVLSVLAVIATAFVMMAELERKASRQRMLSTKAYLLARSGIEDALARLAAGQDPDATGNKYWGEDWDASGGALSALEADQEVYRPGTADRDPCPTRHAMRPNYFMMLDPSVPGSNPATSPVDGRLRGRSGTLPGDYAPTGNTYALKASSPSGFFVNGGDPASTPPVPGDYNDTLRRILGTLAKAIDEEQGGIDGSPVSQADGEALINARPSTGWASFSQIQSVAFGGNAGKMEALRPYLALKAWVDKRVIRPNAPAATENVAYKTWGDIKLGRPVNPSDATKRSPDFERVPVAAGANVGRAPVDLGWARSRRPALIALMAGLKGLYLEEGWNSTTPLTIFNGSAFVESDQIGILRSAEIQNAWIPADDCHKAADWLLTSTSPLSTWHDWAAFCDTIPFTGTTDQVRARRDILKANFNPNSDLNKFNPASGCHKSTPVPLLWKRVDKSDLLAYSTEFTLFPIQGREIQSVGRIVGREGRLLASRTLTATLQGPSVARISTQKEFACSNLGSLEIAGDEGPPRLPGTTLPGETPFLSLSQANAKTWGHSRAALSTAPAPGTWTGVALQTYPEPCVSISGSGGALSLNAADYDGNLQLATVETMTNQWYAVGTATQQMKMLARFDDGFDLDVAAVTPANQTDAFQVTTAQLGSSLLDATRPNTLYPDGGYSERDRAPAYLDSGNANGLHGLMSFWFKKHSDPNDPLQHGRSQPYVVWTNRTDSGLSSLKNSDQFFCFCYCGGVSGSGYRGARLFFEIGNMTNDVEREHGFVAQSGDPALYPDREIHHWWNLLTFYYDFQAPTGVDTGRVVFNDGTAVGSENELGREYYNAGNPNASTAADDITQPNTSPSKGAHMLALGRTARLCAAALDPTYNGNVNREFGYGVDSTLDEFAVYDFGGAAAGGSPAAPADTLGAALKLAGNRWKEGRYYKEADYRAPGAAPLAAPPSEAGSWVSAPFTLPAGTLLQQVHWTWYPTFPLTGAANLPPDDYAEIELLNAAGDGYLEGMAANSRSTLAAGFGADRQRWDPNRVLPAGSFRVRVVFRRKAAVAMDTPLLVSPVFDDLSLVYLPASSGAPRYLSWQEGGE